MVDLKGKPFGSEALKGNYYLLFFGSSLCPDTCPLTLMKMMKVYREIERSAAGKQYCRFIPVFVATNSKYDTAKAITKFRDSMFGKDLICLLEDPKNPAKMQQMLKKFKVPAGLTPEEAEQTIALFA